MIKEVVSDKLNNNLALVVDCIDEYSERKYSRELLQEARKVKLLLVKEAGVYTFNEGEVYVGEEPVCVKEKDNSYIIMPLSTVCQETGNVVFVHVLLHALGKEIFIKEGKSAFNEVIVDYMANEIAKLLEGKKINITMCDNPNYESNSFYSNLFKKVATFYSDNKNKIIAGRMGTTIVFENIDEYIDEMEQIIDKVFESSEIEDELIVKRGK